MGWQPPQIYHVACCRTLLFAGYTTFDQRIFVLWIQYVLLHFNMPVIIKKCGFSVIITEKPHWILTGKIT